MPRDSRQDDSSQQQAALDRAAPEKPHKYNLASGSVWVQSGSRWNTSSTGRDTLSSQTHAASFSSFCIMSFTTIKNISPTNVFTYLKSAWNQTLQYSYWNKVGSNFRFTQTSKHLAFKIPIIPNKESVL